MHRGTPGTVKSTAKMDNLCGIVVRFKKGSGTFVRSTLRAVPAKVPDLFLNPAYRQSRAGPLH
jgi:hypothetical protein